MEREDHLKNLSVNLDDHLTASVAGRVSRLSSHPANAAPEPGALLASRFLLQRLIGRGGSGSVFEARDQQLGQRVAVKVLHPEAATPEGRERVRREVRAARSHHPHLVQVHDLHETDGLVFLSLELVEGRSLREVLADRARLDIDEAVSLGRQLADALAHLHSAGIVHRDVKPGNVLVTPEGVAKLCDLGLARPYQRGGTVTETAMVVGTPAYMAPEQGRSAELSPASDVYALGLTLHYALTGEVPLRGDTAVGTLIRRQRERAPWVRRSCPEAPPWLARLLSRMLDPAPAERPTAAEVAQCLEQRRLRPRLPPRAVAALAMVLGLAGVAGWGLATRQGAPRLEPGSPSALLAYRWLQYEDRAHVELVDGTGAIVRTLVTPGAGWSPEIGELFGVRRVAIADLDGDRLDDVIHADGNGNVERQLQIYHRSPDGDLTLAREIDIHTELEYEGRRFGRFMPRHVTTADVTGDGRPEILLVQYSLPYYPGLATVLTAGGDELARIWHPGHLTNVMVGDRDRDGVAELYLGGTTDFLLPGGDDGSFPVVLAVEADWQRGGLEINLFGPGERPAATTPPGVEVVYIAFTRQRLTPPATVWEHAAIRSVHPEADSPFLDVRASRTAYPGIRLGRTMARTFYFDRRLSLVDAMWHLPLLLQLGIGQDDPGARADLIVRYWNGAAWQDEVCAMPQETVGVD